MAGLAHCLIRGEVMGSCGYRGVPDLFDAVYTQRRTQCAGERKKLAEEHTHDWVRTVRTFVGAVTPTNPIQMGR